MRGFTIFALACIIAMLVFSIGWTATHKSKAERISDLEHQVDDLQVRVAKLEKK